jgi:hypothetical protein
MKIRIDGGMSTTNTEELSPEASRYIEGMVKLSAGLGPIFSKLVREPAFLFASSGNHFFSVRDNDPTLLGDGIIRPALACFVVWKRDGMLPVFLMCNDIEFNVYREGVTRYPDGALVGSFSFRGGELEDIPALTTRFRALLTMMAHAGAWIHQIEILEFAKLLAGEDQLSLSTSTGD